MGKPVPEWVSQYQKSRTSLDLNEARDDGVLGWQWHQLDHMQTVCTSLQTNTSPDCLYMVQLMPLHHNTPLSPECQLCRVACNTVCGMWVPIAVWQVRLRTAISVYYYTLLYHSIFTGRILFLTPSQQCRSTEGKSLVGSMVCVCDV